MPGATDQPSALRRFPATPDFVMRIAPQFRDFTPTSRPTQADVIDAAWHVRKHLGVSPGAWGEACVTLGRWPAAVAIAAIAARHEVGEVRSPGGLLRRMIELHERDELHLDRTLYGLAARSNADPEPAYRGRPAPVTDGNRMKLWLSMLQEANRGA